MLLVDSLSSAMGGLLRCFLTTMYFPWKAFLGFCSPFYRAVPELQLGNKDV